MSSIDAPAASAVQTDHERWNVLLAKCVQSTNDGHSTVANYDCFAEKRDELGTYLAELASYDENTVYQWDKDVQLAFLINAYNAWTVELILSAWPSLESIKDLGSLLRSPWKKRFIPLMGEERSLDDIEHGMIREPGRFDDPRIHFAVNCASIGCPALRNEAYRGARIDRQLEDQTERFLADSSRNRLRNGELQVSSLFKWYRGDFEKNWRDLPSLEAFLAAYAPALGLDATATAELKAGDLPIEFLDYDWQLNAPAGATN